MILSDIVADPDAVLIVNLTDASNHGDKSCVLEPKEHVGVITKRSCVNYGMAQITSEEMLEAAMTRGLLILKSPLPGAALAKILDGATITDELSNRAKLLLRNQGLIP